MQAEVIKPFNGPGSIRLERGTIVETETWRFQATKSFVDRGYLRLVDAPPPLEDLNKRGRVLALFEAGELDIVIVAQRAGCSTSYVRILKTAFGATVPEGE